MLALVLATHHAHGDTIPPLHEPFSKRPLIVRTNRLHADI